MIVFYGNNNYKVPNKGVKCVISRNVVKRLTRNPAKNKKITKNNIDFLKALGFKL